jgi:hypothetical protein
VNNYKIIKNDNILDTMQNIKNIPKASLKKAGTIEPIIKHIQRNI